MSSADAGAVDRTPEAAVAAPARTTVGRPYSAPALRCYGSVVATTMGSTGGNVDSGSKTAPKKV